MRTRTVVWLGFLAGLGLVIAAALLLRQDGEPFDPDGRRAAPIEEIVIAYPENPLTLNPYAPEGDTTATRDLLRPVLPTLLNLEPRGSTVAFVPGLARAVPAGEQIGTDLFNVTFTLDPEARWSDGEPIDANDVRFTWQWIRDPSNRAPQAAKYSRLTDVVVVDAGTVRLEFDGPHSGWRTFFGAGDFILPQHALQQGGALAGGPPVSGGPYRILRMDPEAEVTYEANPQWWGPEPLAERVRVQFAPVLDVALGLFREGRIDAIATTSQPALTERLSHVGAEITSAPGHAWWELGFNVERSNVNELRDRRALAQEIDRAGFIEALVRDEGDALQSLIGGVEAGAPFGRYRPNPRAAAAERRQAGGVGTLTFSVPSTNEMATLVQRAFITQLDAAGVEAEPRNPEVDEFYGRWLTQGAFDIAVWEMRGYPDTASMRRFHSKEIPSGRNWSRLQSAAIDRVVDRLERNPLPRGEGAVFDPALLGTAMQALASELPALPLFEVQMFIGHREGILGPSANASIDGPLWNLADWGSE